MWVWWLCLAGLLAYLICLVIAATTDRNQYNQYDYTSGTYTEHNPHVILTDKN